MVAFAAGTEVCPDHSISRFPSLKLNLTSVTDALDPLHIEKL